MKWVRNVLFISMILILSCVAPSRVVMLKPLPETEDWLNGVEYVNLHGKNVDIRIGYVGDLDYLLYFSVFIYNKSPEPILIDPAHFYYLPLFDTTEIDFKNADLVKAIDPEEYKIMLEKNYAENSAHSTNMLMSEVLFNLGSLLGTLSGKSTTEDRIYESNVRQEYALRRIENKMDEQYLLKKYVNLKENFLQKTTLLPDKIIGGYVYFPERFYTFRPRVLEKNGVKYYSNYKDKKACNYYFFQFPIGQDTLSYLFKVKKY